MRNLFLVFLSVTFFCLCSGLSLGHIKHVIVLMLENRSFDHMLGFLKSLNAEINGCLPEESGCSNHINPLDKTSPTVTVDNEAVYVQVDPHHTISWTTEQIFGIPHNHDLPKNAEPTMDGFISSYADCMNHSISNASSIMKCFAPEHLAILSNLSMEFGVFDSWFSSVPGPTMVNRAYAASASSHGMGTNDVEVIAKGMPQKTMFRQLLDMGLDYRIYFQDIPHVLMFDDMRDRLLRGKYRHLEDFFTDVAEGNLPEYTWIEPAYLNNEDHMSTDQHPDHDVSLGEQLIKDIYEGLRASPLWESSALLITYDEHGGFFDHVPPPSGVPNPDGINATDDPFDFTRLGVRVPTVVVSPWVQKGSVFNLPFSSEGEAAPPQYEHSSLISTVVHKLFAPEDGYPSPDYLNERDQWAATFEHVFDMLKEPRADCPAFLPDVYKPDVALPPQDGKMLLSPLQRELVALMAGVASNETMVKKDVSRWTEQDAFVFASDVMSNFLHAYE